MAGRSCPRSIIARLPETPHQAKRHRVERQRRPTAPGSPAFDEVLSATSVAPEHHHWHCCLHASQCPRCDCACNVGDAQVSTQSSPGASAGPPRVLSCVRRSIGLPEPCAKTWNCKTAALLEMRSLRLASESMPNMSVYPLYHLHSTIDDRAANIPGMSMTDYHAPQYAVGFVR
jgi:hypothetical protein